MPTLNSLFVITALAIFALSFAPVHVNALVTDRTQIAPHVRVHDVVAGRKRTDASSDTKNSGKKWGLAGTDAKVVAHFANLPKVGFYYNWRAAYFPSDLPRDVIPIPMLWGEKNVDEFKSNVKHGVRYVLAMNEPNEPSQSNMSPSEAVNMYMTHINPLASTGTYAISPACTDDDSGLAWYQEFFTLCKQRGCIVSAIAFHAYTNNATHLIAYATHLHKTYNLDVWITEFADTNFSGVGGQPSMDEVWNFAGRVTAFINNTPWIKAAFPFGALDSLYNVAEVNNLQGSNGMPTPLGYYYFG